jgi:hypothetical protein
MWSSSSNFSREGTTDRKGARTSSSIRGAMLAFFFFRRLDGGGGGFHRSPATDRHKAPGQTGGMYEARSCGRGRSSKVVSGASKSAASISTTALSGTPGYLPEGAGANSRTSGSSSSESTVLYGYTDDVPKQYTFDTFSVCTV